MTNKEVKALSKEFIPQSNLKAVYSFGWERMKKYFLDLFLVIVIVGVVLIPLLMIQSLDGRHTPGGVILRIFSLAYWLLLFVPIDYGTAFVFLKSVRGETFEVKDMFLAFENYLNVVLAKVFVSAIIAIGIVLLVVPGIILACRLAFVKYLVMDKRMDPVQAVKQSWEMTNRHAGTIFLMGILAFLIWIAGLICLAVGVIPATIWIRCAFASMYYSVSESQPAKEVA